MSTDTGNWNLPKKCIFIARRCLGKVNFRKLENAVKKRMISDVPLGAFLKRWLDSSAVVALMAKNSHQKIKTFSVGFDDPKFDETYYAQLVAQKYKNRPYNFNCKF